jgi:hypothetical protein
LLARATAFKLAFTFITAMSITHYCPSCWETVEEEDHHCPACGYRLEDFSQLPYEDKLIQSLKHPAQDKRYVVVEILGKIGSLKALPEFKKILADPDSDYYLLRMVVEALEKIEGPESCALLALAARHTYRLIQERAQRILDERQPDERES